MNINQKKTYRQITSSLYNHNLNCLPLKILMIVFFSIFLEKLPCSKNGSSSAICSCPSTVEISPNVVGFGEVKLSSNFVRSTAFSNIDLMGGNLPATSKSI